MTLLTFLQESANEAAIHKASSALEDSIARSNFEALWKWSDSDSDRDQGSLDAVAKASEADAVDHGFVDRVLDDMWSDDETWIELLKDSSRQAQQRAHFARRPALTEAEREAVQAYADRAFPRGERLDRPDVGSRVQVIRDLVHTCPGGATDAFVRDYVRELPPGWRDSIVLDLKAGEHPVVCRWTATREKISATQAWCRNYRHRDQPRFEALESHWFEGERVVIPAAVSHATVTVEALARPRTMATLSTVSPTGLGPLDAVLATGGIPSGARVVVQAATAQGKTALEIAEAWAARGARVVWVATADEPRESVMARRRQRHGMPRADAVTSTDEEGLAPELFVVDGREHTIEEVLTLSPAPALLVLDPVSKVRMRDGAADPVVRIGGVLDLVEASGWTVLMSAAVVRGAGRRAATERALGGSRIEAGATLLLELTRSGDNLTIGIVKSRLGGEGMEIALRLDAERQRVLAAPADDGALSTDDRIWRDMRTVLAMDGPRAARTLAEKVRGRKTAVLAVVRQRLANGDLRQLDGKVGLP
jgi:hypothetical protein